MLLLHKIALWGGGPLGTKPRHSLEGGSAPNFDQRSKSTEEKSKHADALRIDLTVILPFVQQIVEHHVALARPVNQVDSIARITLIPSVVPGMSEGCHYESCLRQGERRIVVAPVWATRSLRKQKPTGVVFRTPGGGCNR